MTFRVGLSLGSDFLPLSRTQVAPLTCARRRPESDSGSESDSHPKRMANAFAAGCEFRGGRPRRPLPPQAPQLALPAGLQESHTHFQSHFERTFSLAPSSEPEPELRNVAQREFLAMLHSNGMGELIGKMDADRPPQVPVGYPHAAPHN